MLASALFVDLAFVRPCPDPPPTPTTFPLYFTPFILIRRGIRSFIGESLGCGNVHARVTRDLVSSFTISPMHPTGSGFIRHDLKCNPTQDDMSAKDFRGAAAGTDCCRTASQASTHEARRLRVNIVMSSNRSNTRWYIRYTKYTFYKTWFSLSQRHILNGSTVSPQKSTMMVSCYDDYLDIRNALHPNDQISLLQFSTSLGSSCGDNWV